MPNMNDITRLIKQAAMEAIEASSPVKVLFGKVISIEPLKIMVDQKLVLTTDQLVLTRNVVDHQTELSFDDANVKQVFTTWNMDETTESSESKISFKQSIKHKITIYNALKVGDEVILLQIQGGQKFVIIERVVTPA